MKAHFASMWNAVYDFGEAHNFRQTNGYDPVYRIALMTEELGELSECFTKGKSRDETAEELADLFIMVIGTAIGCDIDLEKAFWDKIYSLNKRKSKIVNGRVRMTKETFLGREVDEDGEMK